jgi:hypothetical protein
MNSIRRSLLCVFVIGCLGLAALSPGQSTADADAARAQALNLFKIYRSHDWKGLYDVTAFSPAVSKTLTNRDEFATGFEKGLTQGDPNNDFGKLMDGLQEISAGCVIIENDSAYVATSCIVTVDTQKVKFLGIAKLIKSGGEWKWDLTFSDDTEKATEKRFTEILGDPAKS